MRRDPHGPPSLPEGGGTTRSRRRSERAFTGGRYQCPAHTGLGWRERVAGLGTAAGGTAERGRAALRGADRMGEPQPPAPRARARPAPRGRRAPPGTRKHFRSAGTEQQRVRGGASAPAPVPASVNPPLPAFFHGSPLAAVSAAAVLLLLRRRLLLLMKPVVVFVLGGPGAGKGTQCARIVEVRAAELPAREEGAGTHGHTRHDDGTARPCAAAGHAGRCGSRSPPARAVSPPLLGVLAPRLPCALRSCLASVPPSEVVRCE